MRQCRSCGRLNPDDSDFCECGEYLRWEPTTHVAAVSAAPASDTAAGSGSAAPAADQPAPASDQPAPAGGQPAPTAEAEAGGSVSSPPPLPGVDPNITLGPGEFGPGGPGGAVNGAGSAAAGVGGEPPPGAALLTLRLPDGDGAAEGPVTTSVDPGARVMVVGLIRNQSDVVDNFDLSVRGLPEGWWTVAPATAYLVPYGSGGTYEQEIQIHLHPPRSPLAQARDWPFEVVATSRAFGGEVAAAPATLRIGPYQEIVSELRPDRASGRLKARYLLTVHNRANSRTEVDLSAQDTDDECKFRFAEPRIALEPGNGLECPITVFPPKQIWIGRPKDRQVQVTALPAGADAAPPRMATYRQRPWLPWWMAIVAPIVIALAVLVIKVLPKHSVVPNLKGQPSMFAAQKVLNKLGLKLAPQPSATIVAAGKPPGSIADQTPAAGAKATRGTVVSVAVYGGTGQVKVPSVVGDTPGQADQALIASGLALGAVSPQPLNPNGKISSQLPLAGTPAKSGMAVNVFLAAPVGAAAGKRSGSGSATTSGAGSGAAAAGAAASGAAAAAAGAAAAATSAQGKATPAALSAAAKETGGGPIKIPAVPADPQKAAAALSQLGLVPQPLKQLSTAPVGQVAGTVPAVGASVAKGATVDLLISSGSPQLAYDNGTSIQVIDPPATKPSLLVPPGPGGQVEPAWSPDGSHLVYSQNGQLQLLAATGSSGSAQPITTPPAGSADRDPAFAPTTSGIVIAFVRRQATSAKLCFVSYTKFASSSSCTSAPGWDLGGQLAWSPDGKTILALGTRKSGTIFGLLAFTSTVPYSAQASNWGRGTLQTNASVPGQGVFAAAFSPNGKQMALVAGSTSGGFNLYIVPVGDYAPTQGQQLPVTACQVSWRPDGQQLAVVQPSSGCTPTATGTLVAVSPKNPRQSVTLATNASHPAWQPVLSGG